jgi:hypothetical protein
MLWDNKPLEEHVRFENPQGFPRHDQPQDFTMPCF